MANSPSPIANGTARPPRSIAPPTTTMPISEPRKNAEKTQPYSSMPAELVGDDRHDRRDRERLEADERDGQDETDASARADPGATGCPAGPRRLIDGALVHPERMAENGSRRAGWRRRSGSRQALDDRRQLVDLAEHERRMPRRARRPWIFSTSASIEPMNTCGDSRTSSTVSSMPVRARRSVDDLGAPRPGRGR